MIDKLYFWTAKRSGPAITIRGRLGGRDGDPVNVTNVETISINDEGEVIASTYAGQRFALITGERP